MVASGRAEWTPNLWPAGGELFIGRELCDQRNRGVELPCGQSPDPRCVRGDPFWRRAADAAPAEVGAAIRHARLWTGLAGGGPLDVASAANRVRDLHFPKGGVAAGAAIF